VGATNQTYGAKQAYSYTVKETNTAGCTAISAATTIVVNAAPTASITTPDGLDLCGHPSGVSLVANGGSGLTYQWQKGMTVLNGATNQTYVATTKSSYKVVVTNSSGCSKTSAAAKVVKTCKEEMATADVSDALLRVYPNPANDMIRSEIAMQNGGAKIQLYNMLAQVVIEKQITNTDNLFTEEIDISQLAQGVYMIEVTNGTEKVMTKVVKE